MHNKQNISAMGARVALFALALLATLSFTTKAAFAVPEERRALFGEMHVHTKLSFDAFIFGNRNGPEEAYRYAKGEAIRHPSGFEMKLKTPLDFQAITDHAVYLGMVPAMFDEASAVAKHPIAAGLRTAQTPGDRRAAFALLFPYIANPEADDLLDMNIVRSAWQEIIDAAERHNEPGRFTTFTAYEFTSSYERFENLHRNVIFEGGAPDVPHSRLISLNPEKLWAWMDDLRTQGMDSISIPHNSNGSDGYMFDTTTYDGAPIDRNYVATRMRNEPIVEMTQVKGTSETHPLLSPNDEFAGFEIMPYQIATWHNSRVEGSFVRNAYQRGLEMQKAGVGNPYKFGMIGASDTHVGAGAFDEDNYWSKIGVVDGTGLLRGSIALRWHQRLGAQIFRLSALWANLRADESVQGGTAGRNDAINHLQMQWSSWGASGLAGVWAEDNTRTDIFAALRRKETFATSGPRLRVRFFGGHYLNRAMLNDPDMVALSYEKGVPMGADLLAKGSAPTFLAWVMRDVRSAPLQRLQIIKGWIDDAGNTHERVYDIACAGGAKPTKNDNGQMRCADNNANVDLSDCSYRADTGADELKAYWRDPDYKKGQNAFYYVRGIENPTCRWSSWDAVRAGTHPNPSLEATIQERVWSSPIWLEH